MCINIFLGNLIVNDAYYKKYYEGNYYTVDLGNDVLNFIIKIMDVFSYRMKERMILSNCQAKKKIDILDVGCGIGMFLNELNSKKFNKYGVEINAKGADEARKKGITVYTSDFLKLKLNKKFDVITMWHVLEHMPDPQQVIKKISGMLRKNGLLVFAVPNSGGMGFTYGKKYWYHLDSPRHLFLPNRSNLNRVLKKNHFNLTRVIYEFYDYPIDLLVSLRYSHLKYLVYPLYPLFKFFSPETLTYIAKKKRRMNFTDRITSLARR